MIVFVNNPLPPPQRLIGDIAMYSKNMISCHLVGHRKNNQF
jgi:hypothetical protein